MQRRALGLALAMTLGACSLMLDGESSPLRCTQEGLVGPPACDEGFVCWAGVCRAAEPVAAAGADDVASAGGDAAWSAGEGGASIGRRGN